MRFVLFAGGLAALSGCFLFQQGPTVVEMRGDHIKPWSRGGKTKPENLQMLCADCNARKSDKF